MRDNPQNKKLEKRLEKILHLAMFLTAFGTLATQKIKFESALEIFVLSMFSIAIFMLLIVSAAPYYAKFENLTEINKKLVMSAVAGVVAANVYLYGSLDLTILIVSAFGIACGIIYMKIADKIFKFAPHA